MSENKTIIDTGVAMFIGSEVNTQHTIVNMDIFTYAGNLEFISRVNRSALSLISKFKFVSKLG